MKLLAVETSSKAASAALWEDDTLVGEFFLNAGLTHSQTIMEMVARLLVCARLGVDAVDCFAVSAGPGSFTGLRIGMSCVKGMAHAVEKPCVAVSTLEGLAANLLGAGALVCPVMDARRNQVYTALFSAEQRLSRIADDEAVSLEELERKLAAYMERKVLLVGDGAALCYGSFGKKYPNLTLAPAHLMHQRAASLGFCALGHFRTGAAVTAAQLVPVYLRPSQAEREYAGKNDTNIKKEDAM